MSESDVVEAVSRARLHEHMAHWERTGRRLPGTDKEREARDYVRERLDAYGIDTRLKAFDYCHWQPDSTEVIVESPVETELDCTPLSYVATDEVEGTLVYAGTGTRSEFGALRERGVELEGAVVLVATSTPFTVTPLVREFGASGLLVVSDAPEGLCRRFTGSFYGTTADPEEMQASPESFPVDVTGAVLPAAESHRLLRLANEGPVRVRIADEATYSVERSWNVVGELPGGDLADETVVIGAHYDTQFGVPGVLDNGTGLAGLLETARCFTDADRRPSRTVEFVAFGCEEYGAWGSVDYVRRLQDNPDRECVAMFNVDSVGSKFVPNRDLWASGGMDDFVLEVADAIGVDVDAVRGFDQPIGDGAPFVDRGVPTAWIVSNRPPSPYYHTGRDDSVEQIDMASLHRAVELIVRSAAESSVGAAVGVSPDDGAR